ncbi:MAG: PhzF family phenazine biosynthesis isomerase, partial [Erysipelotrichales bacterium]
MRVFEVSAFTRDRKGGNKAGVALLYNPISEQIMQDVAAQLKYSETAYIIKTGEDMFDVRFFTPTEEVDLCGHATIASFSMLKTSGLIDGNNPRQHTKAGDLNITIDGDNILMEMAEENIGDKVDKITAGQLLCVEKDKIILEPQIVSVGLFDCMVLVDSLKTLNDITLQKQAMSDFSNENNITGFHVCA